MPLVAEPRAVQREGRAAVLPVTRSVRCLPVVVGDRRAVVPRAGRPVIAELVEIILVLIFAVVLELPAGHARPDALTARRPAQFAQPLRQRRVLLPPRENGDGGDVLHGVHGLRHAIPAGDIRHIAVSSRREIQIPGRFRRDESFLQRDPAGEIVILRLIHQLSGQRVQILFRFRYVKRIDGVIAHRHANGRALCRLTDDDIPCRECKHAVRRCIVRTEENIPGAGIVLDGHFLR